MLHKSFQVLETKADGEHGEFTAIVSTFGNVDRVGDRILPGAWTKTLKEWGDSGDPIPIILAHQWDDPMAHIGIAQAADVKQVKQGLQVTGKLDVEDNPVAKQVYRLMKRRSLKEFSIGYSVPTGGEQRAKDGANEISEIMLAECGPCLKGIDPKTELQAVKSALAAEKTTKSDPPRVEDELQEVKARLDRLEQALEDQKSSTKAEVTDKEPPARSVDPLRQQAEDLALEVASGGLSLLPPIKQAPPAPEPDLMDLKELRQRSRDLMLQVLSGVE